MQKQHYKLSNIPLSPTEEIHLLQIIRETSQNAVNHSRGTEVGIILQQKDDHSIELLVEDNGIGIPPNAQRRNHCGLAIINERSRYLNGQVDIETEQVERFRLNPAFCLREFNVLRIVQHQPTTAPDPKALEAPQTPL